MKNFSEIQKIVDFFLWIWYYLEDASIKSGLLNSTYARSIHRGERASSNTSNEVFVTQSGFYLKDTEHIV